MWQLQEWHNVSGVSSWSPPHVERVRGTDGMQFAPGLAVGDSVELWLGEIYRAIKLVAGEKARLFIHCCCCCCFWLCHTSWEDCPLANLQPAADSSRLPAPTPLADPGGGRAAAAPAL